METTNEALHGNHVHDVIIVGAGPAGLAVAARLREPLPGAQFTSDEHQRYHWIRKHGKHAMSIKNRRTGEVNTAKPGHSMIPGPAKPPHTSIDMFVIDKEGSGWMARWNRLFEAYGIHTLRSPMFFHVDPGDRDGLLSYAYVHSREAELTEIKGAVGKELSKHQRKKRMGKRSVYDSRDPIVDERDRNDYYRPSTPLFRCHCNHVRDRYHLDESLVSQDSVQDIVYDFSDSYSPAEKIFTITTGNGRRHHAHAVVLAVGPANEPHIPGHISTDHVEGACHSMNIQCVPSPNVKLRMRSHLPTSILIVGGGLTSAQLAERAVAAGVDHVYLIMRSSVKVKHFDMDLDWVGKFRNQMQAAFWSADSHEERLQMYLAAREGGSMNPTYKKIVQNLAAEGRLSVMTSTKISSKVWDPVQQQWTVNLTTKSPRPQPMLNDAVIEPSEETSILTRIDYIYFATGVETDHTKLPFLQSMNRDYPIPSVGGFPCITDDMKWRDDVPLFLTGKLAALQLGPGAPNLIGARTGAERIAWNLLEMFDGMKQEEDLGHGPDRSHAAHEFSYRTGRGNKYELLGS